MYSTIIGAFLLPALVLLGSFLVRAHDTGGFPPSAAADWLLLLGVFDIAVLREEKVFFNLIRNDWLQSNATDLFWILLVTIFILWYLVATSIEPHLVNAGVGKLGLKAKFLGKTLALLVGLVLIIGATGVHICIFTVGNS